MVQVKQVEFKLGCGRLFQHPAREFCNVSPGKETMLAWLVFFSSLLKVSFKEQVWALWTLKTPGDSTNVCVPGYNRARSSFEG